MFFFILFSLLRYGTPSHAAALTMLMRNEHVLIDAFDTASNLMISGHVLQLFAPISLEGAS